MFERFFYIKKRTYILIFVIILIFVGIISSFSKKSTIKNKDNTKQKVLLVATDVPFVPFEFISNGEIVGIDIDILKEISKETGLRFKINEMSFSSIIASLGSKKVDLAIAGMGITDERKKQVDFTIPYFEANFALLSKKKSNFLSLKELVNKTVATQTGTTMYDFLKDYNNSHPSNQQIKILSLDSNAVGIEMLMHDKVDAFFAEELQGKTYAKMYTDTVYSTIKNKDSGYAIALQKNSPYTAVIDNAIKKLKQNGSIDRIVQKWEQKYINKVLKKKKKQEYKASLFFILKGSLITIQYSLVSIVCGLIMALIWILLMYSGNKILFILARCYVSIIRGTPLLLQMSFVYFVLSKIIGVNLSIFSSAVIALSLNSAAYVIEIIRSGIRSIDRGQFEACKSLNLSKYQAVKDIYIPQVIHNIFPALINEFISLIKESSIVSIFGGYEIMKRANIVISEYYSYFTPLLIAGLSYYIMTFLLEMLAYWWEKKYKY